MAQLLYFVEVIETKPLPRSRRLSKKHESAVAQNSYLLNRLPAMLTAPKARTKLVNKLRAVEKQLMHWGGK